MIKFFRHIRQRMIKENRVSKYLLYAIGEIVLVMIGILLALQVNNWNEERHQKDSEALYLTQLLEETKADSIFFQSRLGLFENQFKSYSHLIQLCEGTLNDSLLKSVPTGNEVPFLLVALGSATLKSITQDGEKISDPLIKQRLRHFEQRYEFVKAMITLFNDDVKMYCKSLRITLATLSERNGNSTAMTDYKLLCVEENFIGKLALLKEDIRRAQEIIQSFLVANETLKKDIIEYLQSNE